MYIWAVTHLTVTRNKPSIARPFITTFNGNSGFKWVHVHSSYVKQVWNSIRGNRSIVESIPLNTQPNPSSTTTSSPTATRTQTPISQPKDQLASTSSSNQNHVYNPNERLSKAPVLLLGDSIIRGIQQRKFAPNRYVNKQTIAGGTREISQYVNHMQERND